jgi:hypothetical protein
LGHDDREICDPFEEASSDVKVAVALSPGTHEFDDIDPQVTLEVQVVDHDDDLLGWIIWSEYLLPLGDILLLHYLSQPLK